MKWGAQEESEGLFYAVSETERIGPYPSFDEAQVVAYQEELKEIEAELGTGLERLAEVLSAHGALDDEGFQAFLAERLEERTGIVVP